MLIGIMGHAGSGKDTMAQRLMDKYNFARVALADPIKRYCKELFKFSDEQLWGEQNAKNQPDLRYPTGLGFLVPRVAYQTLGDWGRNAYEDIWVDYALDIANAILQDKGIYDPKKGLRKYSFYHHWLGVSKLYSGVVIPDVRYRNEMTQIRRAGGTLIRVRRIGAEGKVGIKGHSSEAEQDGIPDDELDYVLTNEPGIYNFHKSIDDLMEKLKKKRKDL